IPTDPRGRWLSRKSDKDMRDGRHRLCPVSRVCRKWNPIAVDILYTQIQVTIGEHTSQLAQADIYVRRHVVCVWQTTWKRWWTVILSRSDTVYVSTTSSTRS